MTGAAPVFSLTVAKVTALACRVRGKVILLHATSDCGGR